MEGVQRIANLSEEERKEEDLKPYYYEDPAKEKEDRRPGRLEAAFNARTKRHGETAARTV